MERHLGTQASALLSELGLDTSRIERWLIDRIAALTAQPHDDIDVSLPFSYHALDSVATVTLTAELEDWLEMKLPATLIWDYPSIEALSEHLTQLQS